MREIGDHGRDSLTVLVSSRDPGPDLLTHPCLPEATRTSLTLRVKNNDDSETFLSREQGMICGTC